MTLAPVLTIRSLKKRRERGGAAFELRIPQLDLLAGQFYGVIGPSGSGKSTLLDTLALVLRPTAAEAFKVAGPSSGDGMFDVDAMWRRDDEVMLSRIRQTTFGYVLQSGGLLGFATVRQNLELPFQIVGRAPDRNRIESLAEQFGVASELNKKPRFLSGGQRQRVAILRALMLAPPLILADEPTAAIDHARAQQVVSGFRDLALENNCTIVMVSHDTDLVESVADDILELSTSIDPDGAAVSTSAWRNAAQAKTTAEA